MAEQVTNEHDSAAERAAVENRYARIVDPEVQRFLATVQALTVDGRVSHVTVFAAWADLIDRVTKQGASPTLLAALRESQIPDAALDAATATAARWAIELTTPTDRLATIRTALGLDPDPAEDTGGKYGRILRPDGAYSWSGATQAAAQTSATADFGQEMIELGRAEGYDQKRWISRLDSKVRDTHLAADDTTIGIEETFIIGGAALRFPGDPLSMAPSETINCRCVLVLVRSGARPWDFPEGAEPWNDPYPG